MGRKRIIKIPISAKIICPNCNKTTILKVEKDSSPQFFECNKCKQRTQTPITKCCVICAFSNKNCVHTLRMEAHKKHLEIKETEKKEKKFSIEESINNQIKKGFENSSNF